MGNESNNLKKEFKEFIGSLSTAICKDVLTEEMDKVRSVFKENEDKLEKKIEKKIDEMKKEHSDFKKTAEKIEEIQTVHEGFKKTEENYKLLYLNNKDDLKSLRQEVVKLEKSNENFKNLSNDVKQQTVMVAASLEIIQSDHEKVVENIVDMNQRLFVNCTEKIQTANKYEREFFLRELENQLNNHTNYYFKKLDEILHSDPVEYLQKSIEDIAKNQEKKSTEVQLYLDEKILKLENETNSHTDLLENKIQELSKITLQLNRKMNLFVLLVFILFIIYFKDYIFMVLGMM